MYTSVMSICNGYADVSKNDHLLSIWPVLQRSYTTLPTAYEQNK